MVQALINISKHANRVINVVKAKYDLKDKSEAINLITEKYEEEILEPGFRPEFVEKMKKVSKEKRVKVKSFKKRFGIK